MLALSEGESTTGQKMPQSVTRRLEPTGARGTVAK
jgi:hypothetical protein